MAPLILLKHDRWRQVVNFMLQLHKGDSNVESVVW